MDRNDHHCEWREQLEKVTRELNEVIAKQAEELASLRAILEKLQRHTFGKRSEKMPSVAKELRDKERSEAERIHTIQTRRENAEKKRQLETRRIEHKVNEEQKSCPKCGGSDFSQLGEGIVTEIYELLPGIIERQLHAQEKLRCRCGEHIITAEGPTKVYDKARFGPMFMAQVAVSKCSDSLPLYRQAKAYRRAGIPIDDSTLGDLFHRSAEIVRPVYERLLELISEQEIVQADETTQRIQAKGKTRTGWLWSFIAKDQSDKDLIGYTFARSRSGETPVNVLKDSLGKLVVDGYSGYNKITLPGGRERAGCLAHARRKFFEAKEKAPEAAKMAMDYILAVYKIEREAAENDLLGTPEHYEMRQVMSQPVMGDFKDWLDLEKDKHLPKGPMGGSDPIW